MGWNSFYSCQEPGESHPSPPGSHHDRIAQILQEAKRQRLASSESKTVSSGVEGGIKPTMEAKGLEGEDVKPTGEPKGVDIEGDDVKPKEDVKLGAGMEPSGEACPESETKDVGNERGGDVSKLLELESNDLLRREQLNAPHRKQNEGDGEDGKPTKKPKAKGKPAAKSKSAKAKAKSSPKSQAKSKAQSKSKAKSNAKAKTSPKKKEKEEDEEESPKATRKARKVEDAPNSDDSKKGDGKKERKERGSANTWARRYPPTDPVQLLRFESIKHTFEADIGPRLLRQSAFQDWFEKHVKTIQNHFVQFTVCLKTIVQFTASL